MIEFDPKKAAKNFDKHGVRFSDCEPVFYDERALPLDEQDVDGEQRYVLMGLSAIEQIVVLVWTPRGENYRIISARRANKRERKEYEK